MMESRDGDNSHYEEPDSENSKTPNIDGNGYSPTKYNNIQNDTKRSEVDLLPKLTSSSRLSTEIISQLFGSQVGAVVSDYACTFQRKSGRLYAGQNAACFYSILFGFEHRFMIQWHRVDEIKSDKTNGIRIVVKDDNGREEKIDGNTLSSADGIYVFKGLTNRCETLRILEHLHTRALSSLGGKNRNRLGINNEIDTRSPSSSSERKQRKARSIQSSIAHLEDIEQILYNIPVSPNYTTVTNQAKEFTVDSKIESQMEQKIGTNLKKAVFKENKPLKDNEEDIFSDLFAQMSVDTEPSFTEIGLNEIHLPCTLKEFHDNFLADNAPYSQEFYHKNILRNTNLNTLPWQKNVPTSSSSYDFPTPKGDTDLYNKIVKYREFTFNHKVKTPVGNSMARGFNLQTLYHFPDDIGFILDSRIECRDVLTCDCFYVDQRWFVKPVNARNKTKNSHEITNEEKGVIFTTKYELRFVKKTVWKPVIIRMTIKETNEGFKDFEKMLRDAISESPEGKKHEKENMINIRENENKILLYSSETSRMKVVMFLCLILSCLMSFVFYLMFEKQFNSKDIFFAHEMKLMKDHILQIENTLKTYEKEIDAIKQVCLEYSHF